MSYSATITPANKPADPYKAKNKDDSPDLSTKVDEVLQFVDGQKIAMMTTRTSHGRLASRAMAVAAREHGIDLLFFTNTETGKTDDMTKFPDVNISFYRDSTGEWASFSGKADVTNDRGLVHKHYSRTLKAWVGDLGDGTHDGGPDDPRIGVIMVKVETVTYAIQKSTQASKLYEVAKGAMTGDAAQVNTLREVSEAEVQQYRSVHT